MSILVEHNGANINDYVVACDQVPRFYMNLDGTLGLPDYSMEVSNVYLGTFTQGDIINVTVNGVIIHNGIIKAFENLYESRTTRLTIWPTLANLRDHKIDPDTLDIASTDPEKYCIETFTVGGGFPDQYGANVKLLWFLQCLFTSAGLTLDTSGVVAYQTGTVHETVSPFTAIPFTGNDIALDEGAIYCLNQNFACPPPMVKTKQNEEGQTVTDWEAIGNQPDYFDVVTQILGYLYWGIIFDGTYKLVPLSTRTSATISDNNKYLLSRTAQAKEIAKCVYSSKFALRANYVFYSKVEATAQGTDIYSAGNMKDRKTIQWMNNLWFMVRDRRTGAAPGALRTSGTTGEIRFSPAMFQDDPTYMGPLYMGSNNLTKDKIITDTETDFNTNTLNVFEHYFDLKSRHTILKEINFL